MGYKLKIWLIRIIRKLIPDNCMYLSKHEAFRDLLLPAEKKYNPTVFEFYYQNSRFLEPMITKPERERLKALILETVLDIWEPSEIEVLTDPKTGEKKIVSWAPIYGDALLAGIKLGIVDEMYQYSEDIRDYIPFAGYFFGGNEIKEMEGIIIDEPPRPKEATDTLY